MLTRQDQSVEHGLDTLELVKPLKTSQVGSKDVAVDRAATGELKRRIKASGVASYKKVVSTTFEDRMTSRRTARAIGVERRLGGIEADEGNLIVAGGIGSPARVLGLAARA